MKIKKINKIKQKLSLILKLEFSGFSFTKLLEYQKHQTFVKTPFTKLKNKPNASNKLGQLTLVNCQS